MFQVFITFGFIYYFYFWYNLFNIISYNLHFNYSYVQQPTCKTAANLTAGSCKLVGARTQMQEEPVALGRPWTLAQWAWARGVGFLCLREVIPFSLPGCSYSTRRNLIQRQQVSPWWLERFSPTPVSLGDSFSELFLMHGVLLRRATFPPILFSPEDKYQPSASLQIALRTWGLFSCGHLPPPHLAHLRAASESPMGAGLGNAGNWSWPRGRAWVSTARGFRK